MNHLQDLPQIKTISTAFSQFIAKLRPLGYKLIFAEFNLQLANL